MDSEEPTAKTPPYIAFRTFLNFLDRLHESGIPARIDRSYWSKFLNGTVGPQFMSALRSLDLIDEADAPRPSLEVLADPTDRKGAVRHMIERVYSPVLVQVPLQSATWGLLDDAFRSSYGIRGGTSRKAVAFFLKALEYAGLDVSPHLNGNRKSPAPRRPVARRAKVSIAPSLSITAQPLLAPAPGRLHKSIQGFIDDIPDAGTAWSEDSMDRWLASFAVILKHVYRNE